MSVSSINGTAATRQALTGGQTSAESGSAIFSLSFAPSDATHDAGRTDSDLANTFQMMSPAMQSALIASQGSGATTAAGGTTATDAVTTVTGTDSASAVTAVLADLDQLVGTLGSSAALTGGTTGQTTADVATLVAKYRNGGSGQSGSDTSFAGQLFRDLAQDGGTGAVSA